MIQDMIRQINAGKNLSEEQSYCCLETMFKGGVSDADIATLLLALAKKGETVGEIVGFARAMRHYMMPLALPMPAIDLCGTGGATQTRFNTSTAAAFVLASAGVPVAKHGNRGSKQSNGSFDFLEALGLPPVLSDDALQQTFLSTKLCFLFARRFHPAMAAVAAARKHVGQRTIFNMLGPLCNPASVLHQIVGTVSESVAEKMAQALCCLNTERALIIVGADGLDELTPLGRSTIFEVKQGEIQRYEFAPTGLVSPCDINAEVLCGAANQNARLFEKVFSAKDGGHPISTIVCLNAGAAFYCCGKTISIEDGFLLARSTVESGAAWDAFVKYKTQANVS